MKYNYMENMIGYEMREEEFCKYGFKLVGLKRVDTDDFDRVSPTEYYTDEIFVPMDKNSEDMFRITIFHDSEKEIIEVTNIVRVVIMHNDFGGYEYIEN